MAGFIFFLLFIAIVVLIVYWFMQVLKKRREDLQLVARQLKLDFFPTGDESIGPMVSNLEFFRYGERCKVSNLMRGQIKRNGKPVSVAIFDYDYTIYTNQGVEFSFNDDGAEIESSEDSDTFYQTVLVFYDESLNLPGFSLRAEFIWDKLANFVGFEDINFDRFPAFSKSYRLLSNQVNATRDLFQPNLINFYESNKICTEAIGPYVLVFPFQHANHHSGTKILNGKTFNHSRYLQPKEVKPCFDLGLRLLSLLENNMSSVTT